MYRSNYCLFSVTSSSAQTQEIEKPKKKSTYTFVIVIYEHFYHLQWLASYMSKQLLSFAANIKQCCKIRTEQLLLFYNYS